LTFKQASQQHKLTVWKLQSVMMRVRLILVHLPEDGCRVIYSPRFVDNEPGRLATYLICKRKLRSWQHANCHGAIFRRSEPYGARVEEACCQLVTNLGRP
jgi:hypothetical protein